VPVLSISRKTIVSGVTRSGDDGAALLPDHVRHRSLRKESRMRTGSWLAKRWCVLPSIAAVWLVPLTALAGNYTVDCSGGSPGAYTSIGAALTAAVADLATGDRTILLKGNCTENVAIGGGVHRVWIAPQWDSCPWNGCTTNSQPAQITAANANQPVMTVSGASDVTLVHLSLTGGSVGLSITGASVTAYSVSADDNSRDGIALDAGASLSIAEGSASRNKGAGLSVQNGSSATFVGQLPWLQNRPFVVADNGYAGLFAERSAVTSWSGAQIRDNKGPGIVSYGAGLVFGSTCCSQTAIVSGNRIGAYLSESTRATFYGDTRFEANGAIGIYVEKSSHAGIFGVVIEGHAENGVSVAEASQLHVSAGTAIRDNGSAATPWSAGVRVDGSSNGFFDTSNDPAGPATISGNTGPGILVDLGSSIDSREAVVQNNTGEGVRVDRGSVAVLGQGTTLRPNARGTVGCDRTSNVFSDALRRSFACWGVNPEGSPRPARPIAGQ